MNMKSKNFLWILMAIIFIGLFALNNFQGYRYAKLVNEVKTLENKQERIYEDNKRMINTISELESPERIKSVSDNMGMSSAGVEQTMVLDFKE